MNLLYIVYNILKIEMLWPLTKNNAGSLNIIKTKLIFLAMVHGSEYTSHHGYELQSAVPQRYKFLADWTP
jgi:hypothetical protein